MFSGQLCASDKPQEIKVKLGILTYRSLYYADPSLVDMCNQIEIVCDYKTPFLKLEDSLSGNEPFDKINALPITLLQNKKKGDQLLESKDKKYTFILNSDLSQSTLEKQLETFRKESPSYDCVTKKTREYLLKKGVIALTSDSTEIHGPQSYFPEEYEKVMKQMKRNEIKNIVIKCATIGFVLLIFKMFFGYYMDAFFQSLMGLK